MKQALRGNAFCDKLVRTGFTLSDLKLLWQPDSPVPGAGS